MPRQRTKADHVARIARVIDYIGDHLDDDLSLERLADIASYSPYHFHRAFRSLAGETLGDAVRRLRLQRAAVELTKTNREVERVARRAGYASVDAFTRAFAAAHADRPANFRARQRLRKAKGDPAMNVTVETFPGITLAALAHRGPYHAIAGTFSKLDAWAAGSGLKDRPRRSFGIYYDDPESVAPSELRADACIEIAPDEPLPEWLERRVIAPGPVAVAIHVGSYAELERTYAEIYRAWLPTSGQEPGDAPCFEEYIDDPRTVEPSRLRTAIRVPLAAPAIAGQPALV